MMKRMFAIGFILMVFVSFLAFAQEKVLHWNLGIDPGTIDPSYATSIAAQQIDHALFLGLTEIDDETLKVVPRLATSWEASDNGITWTFHLRREAMWSDGTPVTAHDITFAIQRTLDPEGSSPLVQRLYVLKGAQRYHTGVGRARDIGVRAIDNYTVRFTLNKKDDCLPALVLEPVFYPQPRSIVEDYGIDWTKPKHIVTDGAHVLEQWVKDHIILYKSTTYYDAGKVNIDEVYCYMIADTSAALTMYEQGKLDVVRIARSDIAQVKANTTLSKELYIAPSETLRIGDDCAISVTYTYPLAELTKPYVTRTHAALGREKWEKWDIHR